MKKYSDYAYKYSLRLDSERGMRGFLEEMYRLDLKCTPPNKPCGNICLPPDKFCESEGKVNPQERRQKVRGFGSSPVAARARLMANRSAGSPPPSGVGAQQIAGSRKPSRFQAGLQNAKQTGTQVIGKVKAGAKKLSRAAKKAIAKAKKYVKNKVRQGKEAVGRGVESARNRVEKFQDTRQARAAFASGADNLSSLENRNYERDKKKRRRDAYEIILEEFYVPLDVMSVHLDSDYDMIATGVCDGQFYVFREDGEYGYLLPIDEATEEINYFAQGRLDAIGIRFDSSSTYPYEYLKGYLDVTERYDRLNCSAGNKPCGQICIPVSSDCSVDDVKQQRKALRGAAAKGFALVGAAGATSGIPLIAAGSGALGAGIARSQKRKELEAIAQASSPDQREKKEREAKAARDKTVQGKIQNAGEDLVKKLKSRR